jgi:aminoglycoside phosphotransferase (APT) family kinase protein
VLRQVPLLRALAAAGVPVAEVVWFDDDEQWFDVPYFMVRFLSGSTYAVREPGPAFDAVACADVLRSAVEALAQVHRVDHERALPGWETPKDLRTEVDFWVPILQKAAEPAWIGMGERTRDAAAPPAARRRPTWASSTATSRPTTSCSTARGWSP